MKKIIFLIALFSITQFFQITNAQVRFGVNINIGEPRYNAPLACHDNFYYLPEIDVYYNIPERKFIYFDDGGWVFSNKLPHNCQDYDFYNGYKIVINEPTPYLRADFYRGRYYSYRNAYCNRYNNRVPEGFERREINYSRYNENHYVVNRRPFYNEWHRNEHEREHHWGGWHH